MIVYPRGSGSTRAPYPLITPDSSNRRTRSAAALCDMLMFRARSAMLCRPFAWRALRMAVSTLSRAKARFAVIAELWHRIDG